MTDQTDDYFQRLRREYLAEAPARLGELRKDLAAVHAAEPDAVASLKTRFHRLAGSGGSYGFPAITTASREAERALVEHPIPEEAGLEMLSAAIGQIAAAFDEAARELGLPSAPQKRPPFGWRAHLVGGATDLAARLTIVLRDAQYAVSNAPIDTDPGAIPASERPEIAVVIPAPDEDPTGAVAVWTSGAFERNVSVALVADVQAVDVLQEPFAQLALFALPPQADQEIARWARAVARASTSPPSVLLVLADATERVSVSTIFDAAGLRVNAVHSAHAADEALSKELPDLILLDWRLPDAKGEALVRLVRRSPRLALTPVVAIANAEDEEERERALEAGADELLLRPLTMSRIVPGVLHRVARARRLDESVRRDPLSGFLTVGALFDELESVLAYARRGGERLSFLLLDMDHFRRVNEQLGHQTGDQVLAHIARVIRERVRASDLLVRMGGEEFGVLFRHCGPADASIVAEQIRAAVLATPPVVEGTPMPMRLSGGVAGYPDHAIGLRELLLAAERALRQAKETGRDRVVVSS